MRFDTPFGPAWAAANQNGALTAFTFAPEAPYDS
jgi:hypothetical protein